MRDVSEKLGIADSCQPVFFLVRGKTWEIIFARGEQGMEVLPRCFPHGRLGEKIFPRFRRSAQRIAVFAAANGRWINYQFVASERLLIEKNTWPHPQRAVKVLRNVFRIRRHVDSKVFDNSLGDRTVWRGAFNRESTPEAKKLAVVYGKFVSLGVSAEV